MSPIIEKWDLPNDIGFLCKIKNAKYHYYEKEHDIKWVRTTGHNPFPYKFVLDKDVQYKGNYLILHTTGRLFHDFLEVFPLILFLKEIKENFTVILSGGQIIENSKFKADLGYKHLYDFLNFFKISYILMDSNTLNDSSFEYSYVYYLNNDNVEKVLEKNIFFKKFYNDEKKRWAYTNEDYVMPEEIKFIDKAHMYSEIDFNKYNNKKLNYFLIDTIKNFFPKFDEEKTKKIIITGKGWSKRYIEGLDEVEDFFVKIGYEIFTPENYNLFDQLKILNSCDKIICFAGGHQTLFTLLDKNVKILIIHPIMHYLAPRIEDNILRFNIDVTHIGSFEEDVSSVFYTDTYRVLNKIRQGDHKSIINYLNDCSDEDVLNFIS